MSDFELFFVTFFSYFFKYSNMSAVDVISTCHFTLRNFEGTIYLVGIICFSLDGS